MPVCVCVIKSWTILIYYEIKICFYQMTTNMQKTLSQVAADEAAIYCRDVNKYE